MGNRTQELTTGTGCLLRGRGEGHWAGGLKELLRLIYGWAIHLVIELIFQPDDISVWVGRVMVALFREHRINS